MNQQENREIRISPDALIALVVAEAEDRELSRHAESGRDERGLPSFGRISEEDGQAAPRQAKRNRNVKVPARYKAAVRGGHDGRDGVCLHTDACAGCAGGGGIHRAELAGSVCGDPLFQGR